MSNLPSVEKKISVEATRFRSAVSEFFSQTLGKSINWLIDQVNAITTVLNAAVASEVIAVDTTGTSYTATAGYTFVGVVTIPGDSSGIVRMKAVVNGQGYQAEIADSGGPPNYPPFITVAVTGNISVSSTTHCGTPIIKGVLIKASSLSIP